MFKKILIHILAITTFLTSCNTQKKAFEKCIINQSKKLYISKQPYKELEKLEKLLIQKKLINKIDKYNYMVAATQIIEGKEKWKKFYENLKKNDNYNFLISLGYTFTNTCSFTNLRKIDVNKYDKDNLQKYFFFRLTYKNSNEWENIEPVFLFSNYNNKFERLNIVYLLYIIMEDKFEKE